MRIKLLFLIPLLLTMSACVAEPTTKSNSRLNAVKSRNNLICGVSGQLPGFSFVDASGNYSGLDVDVCRAIAAALFDNPNAVEFRNLNAKERFTAVQTGEVDILSRNTTWTMSRDTSVGLDFAPVVFYDGQGMMVRQNSNIKSLENLNGKAICTQTGTTNEQNLADQMRKRGITYKPVVFEDINTAYATYEQGRCDAVTSDKSQLISRRTTLPKPEEHVILEQALSQEPLAPAVADGDAKWGDTVRWVVNTIIKAEELGINSENIEQLKTSSKDPEVRRLLGLEGDLAVSIGLPKDFGARIIKHVGNYGEIYDRNLGSKTKLNLPRDNRNQPWTKGGLLYSPPFR
ncbi:amino acid ABC transporter substrate-binding protein [Plectonema cf. radiosum LEGE 06105]|uniref:Amino acid ABC transporter substrate-binding protein n=1 Tax=Plectonema cf. radiosum LEGE 06105 TaxID=945769 RepID=A0A8J7F0P3_9CYAN|nr:amino acid ABC transporter substrate-binding protein [Plectonema cf. radiosum LEGE 06105]